MNRKLTIMPCLDMINGRVVKGVNFVNIKDAGDPVECCKAYCAAGADELAMLDITATVEGRKTMLEVVRKVADAVTVPFTMGPQGRGCRYGSVHDGRRHFVRRSRRRSSQGGREQGLHFVRSLPPS